MSAHRAWYACEEAECPPDGYVVWHYTGCRGCSTKARAQMLAYPDDAVVQRILGPIAAEHDAPGETP